MRLDAYIDKLIEAFPGPHRLLPVAGLFMLKADTS